MSGLLAAWGIRPKILMGTQWGLYVAACLAEILTLEDAFRLVFHLAELEAAILKDGGFAKAEDFEKHSRKPSPQFLRFKNMIRRIPVSPPRMGVFIPQDDKGLPHMTYFFKTHKNKIGYYDNSWFQETLKGKAWITLEMGRGGGFLPSVSPVDSAAIHVERISIFSEGEAYEEVIPPLLAHLYREGVDIDWASLWHGKEGRRIALPTYPFQRKRFWVDP